MLSGSGTAGKTQPKLHSGWDLQIISCPAKWDILMGTLSFPII